MSIEVMTCVWKHAPVQSGELLILLALADFADDEGGCWPAVETLADRARMTPRNVQRCLRGLAERGLISILDKAGPKGVNRYVVNPGEIRAQSKARVPGPDATDDAGGDKLSGATSASRGVTPVSQGGDAGVTQTVTEPPLEPPVERARAGADGRDSGSDGPEPDDDPKAVERAFWEFVRDWPGFAGMPKEAARKAWFRASPTDRDEAMRKRDAWFALLKAQKKSHIPAPATYLGERLFAEVPEPGEDKPAVLEAKPFGPVWMAARLGKLLAGPQVAGFRLTAFEERMVADGKMDREQTLRDRQRDNGWPQVNRLHEKAAHGQSVGVEASARIEAAAAAMVACPVGGDAMAAWKSLHEARGWPWLPDTGNHPVVYWPVPATDPDTALAALEAIFKQPEGARGEVAQDLPATGKQTKQEAAE